jgi:hypothetical protein
MMPATTIADAPSPSSTEPAETERLRGGSDVAVGGC